MKPLRWIILLALCAGAATLFARGCSDDGIPADNGTPSVTRAPEDGGAKTDPVSSPVSPAATATSNDPKAGTDDGPSTRTDVQVGEQTSELEQGVRGRAVNLRGLPIENATVYLMESLANDIFTQMQLARRKVALPPVARSVTDAEGRFELGLRQARPDRRYELRILHDRHADTHVPGIQLDNGLWFDAGNVMMPVGAVVYGRVTVAGTQSLPVTGAKVYAKIVQGITGFNPAPGRERGVEAVTDSRGNYRFENVGQGLVSISALAPNYAKVERPNCSITHGRDNRFDFELPRGRSISGIVTDSAGQPIGRARVTAIAISARMPTVEEARADERGAFEIYGLVDGPYQLTAIAPGFVEDTLEPVNAGTTDAQIQLNSQCEVRVRVKTPKGRNLDRFEVGIRRHFEGEKQFGNVATVTDRQIRPRDLDREGLFVLGGVDPGGYVVRVGARGFATTYSEPFLLNAGMPEAPLVEVTLLQGGSITGIVTGPDGKALAGATVQTLPNHAIDNPLMSIFAAAVPSKVTRASTTTDASGRYSFDTLTPGTYQLKFAHPNATDTRRLGLVVKDGEQTELSPEVLEPGVIVHGITYVDGVPTAFVKVSVATVVPPDNDGTYRAVAGEAISNAKGEYEIIRQFPAGKYEGRAARQTLGAPIMQVIDFKQTQTPFDLTAGMRRYKLDFAIQSNAIGK